MDFRSLLPLQAVDQLLAQLEHRKAQLPERAVAASSTAALQMARTELRRLEKRQGDITGEINHLEVRGKELDAKKAKYEAQLKSVIALREAEALQHEIAGVAGEHSSLDDAELLLLDESETLDKRIAESRAAIPTLETAAQQATEGLAAAIAKVDAETTAANEERTRLAAAIDGETLALYYQVRVRMSSAAVAEIVKGSCAGCHTSLSVKEQAEMKKVADTSDARCPYCGCLLAV